MLANILSFGLGWELNMDPNNSHLDWSILEKPRLPRRNNEIESKHLKAYCCICNLLLMGLIVLLRNSDENKAPKNKTKNET
jgi:hypothetical protein